MIGGAALGQKRRSTPYVLQGLPAQLRIDSVSEMSVETNKPPSWWEANWEVGLLGTMALDSETKQQIETLFAMLDRDKDGTLTQEDFYLASSDARTNHHKNSIETARDALLQREVDTARTRISARKPSQRNKPPAFIHHYRRRLPCCAGASKVGRAARAVRLRWRRPNIPDRVRQRAEEGGDGAAGEHAGGPGGARQPYAAPRAAQRLGQRDDQGAVQDAVRACAPPAPRALKPALRAPPAAELALTRAATHRDAAQFRAADAAADESLARVQAQVLANTHIFGVPL